MSFPVSIAGNQSSWRLQQKVIRNHTIFGNLLFKLGLKQEKPEKIQLACDVQQVIQHDQMVHISSKPLITISINTIPDLSQAFFPRCEASIWSMCPHLNLLVKLSILF